MYVYTSVSILAQELQTHITLAFLASQSLTKSYKWERTPQLPAMPQSSSAPSC